jgi:hypothetical protein
MCTAHLFYALSPWGGSGYDPVPQKKIPKNFTTSCTHIDSDSALRNYSAFWHSAEIIDLITKGQRNSLEKKKMEGSTPLAHRYS